MKSFRLISLAACLLVQLLATQANAAIVTYAFGTDFGVASFTSGDVTTLAQLVPGLGNPGDFGSFTAGRIALIERGTISFTEKIANAQAAGASGVIILNTPPDNLDMGFDQTVLLPATIPSVRFSVAISDALRAELTANPSTQMTFHVQVSSQPVLERIVADVAAVPEPASLIIWGLGALGCAISVYRRRNFELHS